MNPEADETLERLRKGDREALGELYARYRDRLRRMVVLRLDPRLNGRLSPSDVLQEAYIDALKRLPHYFAKPEASFYGWLRLVVGQRLVDVHREHLGASKRNAGREVSLNANPVPAHTPSLAAHLAGSFTSPSGAAARNEELTRLQVALERLEPLDREVLALRHFEELSNAETAEVLGIERAAASKRYVRALARLKEALD